MESQTQRIVDKILRDAEETARIIVEEARKSAEMMLDQQKELARRKAGEEVSSILKHTEKELEVTGVVEATEANRKANWMILAEKEKLILTVLAEVQKRLSAFTQSNKYRKWLQELIVDAGTVLGGGNLSMLLNEKDAKLHLDSKKLAQAITKETGTNTQLQLSKERLEASGGAVVKTVDNRILVDNTFEAILKRRENQLRLKIAKILF